MKDSTIKQPTSKQGATQLDQEKARYSRPDLKVYGNVGTLTKGSGGTRTDGTMMNKAAMN